MITIIINCLCCDHNFFLKRICPCEGTIRLDVPLEKVTRRLKKREEIGDAPASPDKFKTVSILSVINRSAKDRYSRTKRVESET